MNSLFSDEITHTHLLILIYIVPSGGYEGYRPPFSNAPSSGYGQTQFNTSRDYSNNTYQRVRSPFVIIIINVLYNIVRCIVIFLSLLNLPVVSLRRDISKTTSGALPKDLEVCQEEMLKQ